MKIKKIFTFLILVLAMLLLVTTCGRQKKTYIPVISKGFQHQFWQAVKLGSEKQQKN